MPLSGVTCTITISSEGSWTWAVMERLPVLSYPLMADAGESESAASPSPFPGHGAVVSVADLTFHQLHSRALISNHLLTIT